MQYAWLPSAGRCVELQPETLGSPFQDRITYLDLEEVHPGYHSSWPHTPLTS